MPTPASSARDQRVGYFRWVICGLLFLAATVNYIDRQVIGILKPTLQQEFGWSEMDYADIVFSFQIAYAMGLVLAGRLMDRLGTRIGFAIAIVIWSLAAMAHAEATWFGPWRGRAAGHVRLRVLGLGRGIHGRPLHARSRRVRELPGVHQGGGGVVPEEGAGARHGHLQLGHERRRAAHAAGRAVDYRQLRLVLGVHRHGAHRVPVARAVVADVPQPGEASPGQPR